MPDLSSSVALEFAGHFEDVAAKLHKWVDPLSSKQFWRNPYAHGNSVGHLVLHLTGNLSYYIGAQIGSTGYARNRDREFTEASPPAKEDVLRAFDRAMRTVVETIRKQSESDWSATYSAERSKQKNRFAIMLNCAAHADHHVGHIIYLSGELTGQSQSRAV